MIRFLCGFLFVYMVGRLVGGGGMSQVSSQGCRALRDEFWHALGRLFPWRR